MYARTRPVSLTTIAGAGFVAVGLIGAGFYVSAGSGSANNVQLSAASSASVSVTCPDVASQVGEVPAKAQAGVTAELANLERQIVNVNDRLAREPGQAANQLNDLAGKRSAVIDRIILDITRVGGTAPNGLKDLVDCSLGQAAGGGAAATTAPAAGGEAAATTAPAAGGEAAAGPQTVNCPDVTGALPEIPASAAAEVSRNLALLETQIGEANARLAKLFVTPEGGANFVQNAIVGPLKDKRVAVLNRIATAIGRTADRPENLVELAPCSVNAGGAAEGGAVETTAPAAGDDAAATTAPAADDEAGDEAGGGAAGQAQTVNCPAVAGALPEIPASAAAEVSRNLALLETQIGEANARLAKLFVTPEGGANFVQNAIVGPLKDKRVAVLNRIATAIGRTADRPENLVELAACSVNG